MMVIVELGATIADRYDDQGTAVAQTGNEYPLAGLRQMPVIASSNVKYCH